MMQTQLKNKAEHVWMLSERGDLLLFITWLVLMLSFSFVFNEYSFLVQMTSYEALGLTILFFSYPHVASSFVRVYFTNSFDNRLYLKFGPVIIALITGILYQYSKTILMLIFGAVTAHHHVMQQVGLLRLAGAGLKQSRTAKILSLLLPLIVTLCLLSDPRVYQPPGGGDFSWLHIHSKYNPLAFILAIIVLFACIREEILFYLETKKLLLGKYIQYLVIVVVWMFIPLISKDWIYVYVVGGLTHGLYHLGLSIFYFSEKDIFLDHPRSKNEAILKFLLIAASSALFLLVFIEGLWANRSMWNSGAIHIIAISVTLSHYWFDANIWKRRKS
jgi:hypothetical protein